MRRVAVHFWPADQKAPAYVASTARSSSASAVDDERVVAAELELDAAPARRRLLADGVARPARTP